MYARTSESSNVGASLTSHSSQRDFALMSPQRDLADRQPRLSGGSASKRFVTAIEGMAAEARWHATRIAATTEGMHVKNELGEAYTVRRKSGLGKGMSKLNSKMHEYAESRQEKKQQRRKTKRSKRYKRSRFVLSPQKAALQRWEAVMIVLLCYTAVVTPMEVGFYQPSFNAVFYINQFITVAFLVDLILNFFTAVVDPRTGHLVYSLSYVAKRYLKSWFTVDVISVIPFDALYLGVGSKAFTKLGALRTLRLLRLVKLVRVMRVNHIYKRLELVYTIDYSLIELMKFAFTAVMFAHWLACGYGLVEELEGSRYSWTRSTEFEDMVIGPEPENPRDIIGSFRLYLAALYWSTMTISTIGYGDIVPVTTGERVYVIIAMLVGAFEYGYIVGAVSNIIATRNEKMNRFQGLMRDLNGFLVDHRFPQELRVRLREYFRYQLDGADAELYKKLLGKMSPALRSECTMRMNTWMRKLDFFTNCPEPFVMHLSTLVIEQTYPPEESIFTAGDVLNKIFLIRKGVIDVNGRIKVSGKTIAEESLYSDAPVMYDARAVTYADIFTLDRESFQSALANYPATKRYFRLQGIKMVFRQEILAFSNAWWSLKRLGVDADLSGSVNPRPEFYLRKLRMIYGEDGEGLDNPKLLEQKTRAAIVIQKRFRGMLHRVLLHRELVERGVQGVFHKVLRERDPVSYTAHALDVFHWRLGYSLTEVHRKINAVMDAMNVSDLAPDASGKNKSGLMAAAIQAASGSTMTAPRQAKQGDSTPQARVMVPQQQPESVAPVESTGDRSAGWDSSSTENPVQRLQSRVDELTNRLVPLDRKMTSYQNKQTAALAETNERLSDVAAQIETLLSLTMSSMESGLQEARESRETRRSARRQSLSPPPRSVASRF